MRVISLIVHLTGLSDPALHKTTERVVHPSLPYERGVNFALLLSFSFLQFSLEVFCSISSILRELAQYVVLEFQIECTAYSFLYLLLSCT